MKLMNKERWLASRCVHPKAKKVRVHDSNLEVLGINSTVSNRSLPGHYDVTRLQVVLLKALCSAWLQKLFRWDREAHIHLLDAPKWHAFLAELIFVQLGSERAAFDVICARTHISEWNFFPFGLRHSDFVLHLSIPSSSFMPWAMSFSSSARRARISPGGRWAISSWMTSL